MKLTEALSKILELSENRDEACRIVEGHLRHLIKKEEGTHDEIRSKPGVKHAYVEYHYLPGIDFGLAYNDSRVWVCMDGVGLFRAEAVGDRLLSEYHPKDTEYMWQGTLKGTSHKQQALFSKQEADRLKRITKECEELRKQVEELSK